MTFPFQPVGPAVNVTAGAASASSALPQLPGNFPARYVRVVAGGRCYIDFGNGAATAVAGTSPMLGANAPEIICVVGMTHFAVLDGPDAGARVSVTPVELTVPR